VERQPRHLREHRMSRQSPTVANETSSGEGSSAVEVVHAAGEGMLTKLDRHG
jgi:hypothetical protein